MDARCSSEVVLPRATRCTAQAGSSARSITGSNRTNLEYILNNVLNPSEEIQDAYRMVLVSMRDGRMHGGTVASETEETLTLRVVGRDEPVALAKADVQSRDVVPVSVMPEGLLATLKDAEVIDLVAYLRTTEQVPLPGERDKRR